MKIKQQLLKFAIQVSPLSFRLSFRLSFLLSFLLFFLLSCFLTFSLKNTFAQKPSESLQSFAGQIQQWTEDLKASRKDLNFMNFPELIDEVLCPQIKRLQSAPYNLLSQDEKAPFLREVVRTYGQVAEYSRDHNYFYCLYFYYKTPEPVNLLELTKSALNQKQQAAFFNRMRSCHREETEGNGDPLPFHSDFDEAEEPDSNQFSHEDYKQLPWHLQKQYSNELREAVIELEKSSPPPSVKAPANQNLVLKIITEWTFLPLAFSANAPKKCLIGGVLRDVSPRGTCAPWNNPCGEGDGNFACGAVFNQICISITPIGSISERCYEASKDQPINETEFEALQEGLRQDVSEYCKGKENTKACSLYLERLKEINQYYLSRRRPEGLRGYHRKVSETEADAFCLYGQCGKTSSMNIEIVENIVKEAQSKPLDEGSSSTTAMSSYLTDLVAENATCHCGGNFPCARGCEKGGRDPAHSCRGSRVETGQCMKYVNGALMRTIDVFIEPYCSFDTSSCKSQECVHLKCRGRETSCPNCSPVPEEPRGICNQSLNFPSAICALNLDGKDRLGVNEAKPKIEINRGVFTKCKNLEAEGEHNTALKTIQIDGEDLPLFTESENAKLNSETGELDLLSLKDGDIVVMKSNTRHGHIEIKVPKEKCGIPADDPRTCFCSDFCDARESYTGALKPLAVFQFNPKVVSHLERLRATTEL